MRQAFDEHGIMPYDFAQLTIDQVWCLTCDEKELESSRTATGTPQDLIRDGVIDPDAEDATTLFDLLYPKRTNRTSRSQRKQRIEAAVQAARKLRGDE